MPLNAERHPLVFLNRDEAALLERTRELITDEIGPRANRVGESDSFAWDNFRLLAREGLVATSVPRDYGGSEASMMLRVRLLEELGRVCSASAAMLAGTDGSVRPIVAGAREALKRSLLPALAEGSRQCALALTEPQAGSDLGGLRTIAEPDGDIVRLTGSKKFITRANVSDHIVVVARTPGSGPGTRGLQAWLVDNPSPGMSISPDCPKMGWYGLPFAAIRLDEVKVPTDRLLGQPGQGMAVAQDALLRARISHSAIALGRMSAALQIAAQYVSRRRARGVTLGELQGIQWKLAGMGGRIETVRCQVYATALRYDRGDADTPLHASIAKMQSTDLSMQVSIDCLQLLGANGYLKTYPLERFMRDAKFNQIGEGTSEIHMNIIGAEIVRAARNLPEHPSVEHDPAVFE